MMTCPNCGNEVTKNEKFCGVCGTRVEEATQVVEETVVETAAETVEETVEETITETIEVNVPEGAADSELIADETPEVEKKAKKGKKALWISLISVVAVLVLSVSAYAFSPTVRNTFWQLVLNEEDYFKHVVKYNMRGFAGGLGEEVALYKSVALNKNHAAGKLEIELGEKAKELICENIADEMAVEVIESIDKVAFDYTSDVNDEELGVSLKGSLNGTDVVSVNVYAEEDELYIQIPELHSGVIKADMEDLGTSSAEMNSFEVINSLVEAIPEGKVLEELMVRYTEKIIEEIDKVEETKDEVSVGDISQRYTKLTATINEKRMARICKSVLVEMREDKELKKVIVKMVDSMENMGYDGEGVWESFVASADEAIEHFDNMDSDDFSDMKLKVSLWVNGRGEIVGIGCKVGDEEVTYKTVQKGKKLAQEFAIKASGQKIRVYGGVEEKDGKVSGDYTIGLNEMKLVKISVKDLDVKKLEDGTISGKISVAPTPTAVKQMNLDSEAEDLISDIRLEIVYKDCSNEKSDATLRVNIGSELLAGLRVTTNLTENGKVKELSGDTYKISSDLRMAKYGIEAVKNLPTLVAKLEKAGMPKSFVEFLNERVDWLSATTTGDYDAYYEKYYDMSYEEYMQLENGDAGVTEEEYVDFEYSEEIGA